MSKVSNPILPGGIYRMTWNESLRRVLSVDEVQIMYDTWSEEEQDWALRTSNPPTLFCKSFHHNFRELSDCVGFEEITEEEKMKFGLDLPMFICRHRGTQWTAEIFSTKEEFLLHYEKDLLKLREDPLLNIGSIMLIPYDRKLGMLEEKLVRAINGRWFSESELLWNAHQIQRSVQRKIKAGIGLHRQGWNSGFPSYYIGGYYDLGDYLRMHEELWQQAL